MDSTSNSCICVLVIWLPLSDIVSTHNMRLGKISNNGLLVFALCAFLLIAIAYLPIVHSEFVLDDVPGILQNPTIGDPGLIFANPFLSFQPLLRFAAYSIAQLSPWPYHLLNIGFHFGVVVMLFLVVRRLINKYAAWIAGLIVAIHPILVESVTWISALSYPQYSFFLMASLYGYLRGQESRKWTIFSWVLFFLAMFSSEKAVVFPAILLALELAFFKLSKNWKRLLPYVVIAILGAAALLTNWGGRVSAFQNDYLMQPVLINPLSSIPTSMYWYLRLIFFPDKLSIYHPELPLTSLIQGMYYAITALYLGLLGITFFKKRRIFFWLFWFFVALTPTFLPMRLAWVVAERYAYFGTIGIVVLVAWGVSTLIRHKKYMIYGYIVAAVVILALLGRTIVRNQDWIDTDSLWIATGKTAPEYHVTHNNLGDMYGRWGDPERAIEEFTIATQIKPDYAEGYHNIGNTYMQLGKLDEAQKYFQLTLKYNPRIWQTHMNLALIYFNTNQAPKAYDSMKRAISLSPNEPGLYLQLAQMYEAAGDTDSAQMVRSQMPISTN